MEILPIRLIAFDLDGTILNSKKEVEPATRAALLEAAARGVVVLPATGRALGNIPEPILTLPGLQYAITSNGAALWQLGSDPIAAARSRWRTAAGAEASLPAGGRLLSVADLPAAKAAEVFVRLRAFMPGELKVFVSGRTVEEPDSHRWSIAHPGGFLPPPELPVVVGDVPAYLAAHDGGIEKICMFFRDMDTLHAARAVLDATAGIEVVQGAPDNLEVTAPGIDKGVGLRALCGLLDIPPAQALAMGDSENDLGMLRAAGAAGVMANGTAQAKAAATYIAAADCDHGGAAEIIRHYLR